MTVESMLQTAQGQALVASLAKAFGIEPAQALTAATALSGALAQRIERSMLSRGGVADVVSLLTDPQSGQALLKPTNLASSDVITSGDGILNVLIGDKHISRGIAANAASLAGIDEETAKKMLPVVASMLVGGLQRQAAPLFAEKLRGLPGLALSRNGSPLPMPGEILQPNDQSASRENGNWTAGAPTDVNMPRRSGPIAGGSPLPVPGDNIPGVGRSNPPEPDDNPFNRLPDIVRRGGVQVPNGGGSLENVIRSILGSLLGQNRGVIGTMIQLFLVRWLTTVARRIFSRVITGR